jgi:hypothetical protein
MHAMEGARERVGLIYGSRNGEMDVIGRHKMERNEQLQMIEDEDTDGWANGHVIDDDMYII